MFYCSDEEDGEPADFGDALSPLDNAYNKDFDVGFAAEK